MTNFFIMEDRHSSEEEEQQDGEKEDGVEKEPKLVQQILGENGSTAGANEAGPSRTDQEHCGDKSKHLGETQATNNTHTEDKQRTT